MAKATTMRFGAQAVLIEDPAVPNTFTAPCGLTVLSKTTNVETNTSNVPDCDDPDLASWLEIDEVSRQHIWSGNGILALEYMEQWRDWDLTGGPRRVRWLTDIAAGSGGGYYEASGLLTTFTESSERGQKWNVEMAITIDGKPTWVPAS